MKNHPHESTRIRRHLLGIAGVLVLGAMGTLVAAAESLRHGFAPFDERLDLWYAIGTK
jgi:hypothetical protein